MFNETLPPLLLSELDKVSPSTDSGVGAKERTEIKVIQFENATKGNVDWRLEVTEKDIEQLKDAEILITDNIVIGKLIYKLPNAKWIQGTFAGVDIAFNRDLKGDVIKNKGHPAAQVTRFTGNSYGHLMFEYCLAFIIGHERGFHNHLLNQQSKDWTLLRSVTPPKYRLISELKITILGVGSIGSVVAKLFENMGCDHVIGYSKSAKDADYLRANGISIFTTNLIEAISDTDYIISILPDTPSTRGLLNYDILSNCNKERKSVLINLGRGTLITENELIRSLDDGLINLAVLDVFETEPLSADSKLWDHEKVLITPHISAETRPHDLVSVFVGNYRKFIRGQPLDYVIDWDQGY